MHDNTDDLLQELAELEVADLSPATQQTSDDTPSLTRQDVLLEATEQAQQAAELAQVAADRSLTLSKEQKESIIEISEALGTWRQASRASLKELRASRQKMSIMVGMTAFLSIATIGGGGWLLWQIQKAAEAAKADVLDLLQTQLVVFHQKTTLKLDELAAVVESFQAELNRLAKSGMTTGASAAPAAYQAPVVFSAATETPIIPDLAQEAAHQLHAPTHHKTTHAAEPHATAMGDQAPTGSHKQPYESAHHAGHKPETTLGHSAPPDADLTPKLNKIETALAKVQQQLQQLLAQQKTLNMPQPTRAISPAALADIRKMIAEQNRQLKIIRAALWKLRQQQMGSPQSPKPHNLNRLQQAIETLTHQIQQLKAQQEKMRAELAALKQQTAKLAADRPYSYRAPPLNLE